MLWEAAPEPGPEQEHDVAVDDGVPGDLLQVVCPGPPAPRITWAPPPDQWPPPCGDTSPSSCPARPGPTTTSSG